ncbi:MAG: hypothetical protein E7614_08110 [Ruminococcaceae bacterium]|nr:hypothetical protein [Oscillospiraceae bacterium]
MSKFDEKNATSLDNYAGTLNFEKNENGTVTVSYKKDGKDVSFTVPDNHNFLQGGFGATDDLGRTLPCSCTAGIYGSKGEYYVGLFYFMWMGEHGDQGAFDINKIVAEHGENAKYVSCGAWGPEQAMHFWGEPLYGYYYSRDEWVIRKHMELITNANVDFLYFDVTNGYAYVPTAKKVMKVCHELNEQGFQAPKVVFYTHTGSKNVVNLLYDEIYKSNYYPNTWFCVDGKPVIVAYYEDNIDDFFSIRLPQWPNEPANTAPSWPWMDFEWPQRVFTNNGVGESISVSMAQHSGSVRFSSSGLYGDNSNRGRSTTTPVEDKSKVTKDSYKYGANFRAQWDRVLDCVAKSKEDPTKNIKYVLITGWNEWVAQRQPSTWIKGEEIFFVDTFNSEYSRDVEMTRGEYFDSYYLQMMSQIAELKGAAPAIIQDSRKAIDVAGDFSQWDDVLVTYKAPKGNCTDRNEMGFGHTMYINKTGRNDIVSAKVTNDTKNMYFYVETAESISAPDTASTWMQLFVNTDGNSKNGWYGYDYIINYEANNDGVTTVAKNTADGKFAFESVGEVEYQIKDNKMMIAVPLEMLNIEDYGNINIQFKWADSNEKITTMEGFYEFGDVAPLGRLNWIYRNK